MSEKVTWTGAGIPAAMPAEHQPAFPLRVDFGDGSYHQYYGMTLRDWFAGQAMQATLNSSASWGVVDFDKEMDCKAISFFAYKLADAMLKEREK